MRKSFVNKKDELEKQLFKYTNDVTFYRNRWIEAQNKVDNVNEQLLMIENNLDKDLIVKDWNLKLAKGEL